MASIAGQRLGDIHPFVLPAGGRVTLFLCRWPTEAPIPVSVPLDATPAERRIVDTVLRAWQGAGLGVRFAPIEGGPAPLTIELEDEAVMTPAGPDTGNAVVDCRLDPLSRQPAGADVVGGAALASARLRIARRTGMDWRGQTHVLSPEELTATLLHELGHGLGFAGHVRRGDTVMVSELEQVQRTGRTLLAGGAFRDPTLRALYALPSGTVVTSVPVDPWRTDLVDRMARLAERAGLEGPFARVGESAARIFWRDADGVEYGLVVPDLARTLRDPRRVVVVPESRVRRALPRSRDLHPPD